MLLICSLFLSGQEPSVVRLNAGMRITNTIIFENSGRDLISLEILGYKPLSEGVLGYHSASDSLILGTNNILLERNPFTTSFRIDANSPAFNSGTTEGLRLSDTLDLDGNPRVSCCGIDMGAFEFFDLPTTVIQQPQDIHTVIGAMPVFLAVTADGMGLQYVWQHNGINLSETSNILQLAADWPDTGIYRVTILGVCCNDSSNFVNVIYDIWSLESGGKCSDEDGFAEILITAQGHEPRQDYAFLWTAGTMTLWNSGTTSRITGLETGVYSVIITDSEDRTLEIGSFFYKYSPIEIIHSTVVDPDNITCDNGRILITLAESNYDYEFYWERNDSCISLSKDLYDVSVGDYTLWITRQGLQFCSSDTFNFLIRQCHFVHRMRTTYISPNGDGFNDYLDILYIEYYPNNTVTVINSFGETIFHARNYNNKNVVWDGRNRNGSLVPDGLYYYIVEVDGFKVMGSWVVVKISTVD